MNNQKVIFPSIARLLLILERIQRKEEKKQLIDKSYSIDYKIKMKIYLDHCAYNRPFDDQNNIKIQLETLAKLHIQDYIKQGTYDLVWSYMSDFENSFNPNIENKKSIQSWENIAKFKCRSSEKILTLGKEIIGKGIRINDALHIACAVESQCKYFITTDAGLINKKVDGIQIINPIDFIRRMEEYNED